MISEYLESRESLPIEFIVAIVARGWAEQLVYTLSPSPLKIFSGCLLDASETSLWGFSPFLSHLERLTLCLSGNTETGPASTPAQCGQSICATTGAAGQARVLLPRASWEREWPCPGSGLELSSPGAFPQHLCDQMGTNVWGAERF